MKTTTVAPKEANKLHILQEYAQYGNISPAAPFTYANNDRENMQDIISTHNLDTVVDGKNDINTAIALMGWLCKRYKHGNPSSNFPASDTPQAIMESADKNNMHGNCRMLSVILAHLLRAYGIKAYHVTCMPYEYPFDDCHVVVNAYIASLAKWIMLDPSSNLYLKNSIGEIIDVAEFRTHLIAGDTLTMSTHHTYTAEEDWFATKHGLRTDTPINAYTDYMAKNMVRFSRSIATGYGLDSDNDCIELVPEKYMQNEASNFPPEYQVRFTTSHDDFWS